MDLISVTREEEVYAELVQGHVSRKLFLEAWAGEWEGDPPSTDHVRYEFAMPPDEADGWLLNVDPDEPGAVAVTVFYWRDGGYVEVADQPKE